ncbi:MAG: hypothetical protein MJ208_00735 [Bacilli bacterium]|nr:hypothetical protein [Bacilli bacterium]
MQRTPLKDNHYNIIGYIDTESNGNKTLRDKHYNILGYYKASSNITQDSHYNTVGHGDILTTLLK